MNNDTTLPRPQSPPDYYDYDGYSSTDDDCDTTVSIYPYVDYTQDSTVRYAFIFAYILVMGLSIIGNLMVVWTVYRSKRMWTVTNYYIANLAVADLLIGMVVMPLKLIEYTAPCRWNIVFSDGVCSFLYFILPVFVFASTLTLVAISLERFIAIVRPLNAKVFATKRRTRRIILGTWVLSALLALPYLYCESYAFSITSHLGSVSRRICNDKFDDIDKFWFTTREPESDNPIRNILTHFNQSVHQTQIIPVGSQDNWTGGDVSTGSVTGRFRKIFFLFLFVCMYVTPTVVILYTCVHMTYRLLRQQSSRDLQPNKMTSQKLEQNKRKIVKVIVAVASAFLISWAPFYLVSFISQTQRSSFLRHSNFLFTMLTTQLCGFLNSCINPFIYNFLCDNFRKSFRCIVRSICYRRGRRRPPPVPQIDAMPYPSAYYRLSLAGDDKPPEHPQTRDLRATLNDTTACRRSNILTIRNNIYARQPQNPHNQVILKQQQLLNQNQQQRVLQQQQQQQPDKRRCIWQPPRRHRQQRTQIVGLTML